MLLLASALDEAKFRSWIWVVVAGLVLGGLLIGHSALAMTRALPDEMRSNAMAAVKRRPRIAATAAAVATWTLVYGLYSLAFPSGAAVLAADARPGGDASDTPLLAGGPPLAPTPDFTISDLLSPGLGTDAFVDADTPTAPSNPGSSSPLPPTGAKPPAPTPCSTAAAADAVRSAQAQVETLTGKPLGADAGVFLEALAGCKDAESAALSLLGPVNMILNDAGIPVLDLPPIPGVKFPTIPEAIAAPLRPQVFMACGKILSEGYSVASAAPVLRVSFEDAVAVLNIVSAACSSFAPARTT